MKILPVIRAAIELWGSEHQWRVFQEEMDELSLAIHHLFRKDANRLNYEKVVEEFADVQITLETAYAQLCDVYGKDELDKKLATIRTQKLTRLESRILEAVGRRERARAR